MPGIDTCARLQNVIAVAVRLPKPLQRVSDGDPWCLAWLPSLSHQLLDTNLVWPRERLPTSLQTMPIPVFACDILIPE